MLEYGICSQVHEFKQIIITIYRLSMFLYIPKLVTSSINWIKLKWKNPMNIEIWTGGSRLITHVLAWNLCWHIALHFLNFNYQDKIDVGWYRSSQLCFDFYWCWTIDAFLFFSFLFLISLGIKVKYKPNKFSMFVMKILNGIRKYFLMQSRSWLIWRLHSSL